MGEAKRRYQRMDELNCIGDMMIRICDVYISAGGGDETLGICEDLKKLIGDMNMNDEQTFNLNRVAALVVLTIHKAHDLGKSGIELELEPPDVQICKSSKKNTSDWPLSISA